MQATANTVLQAETMSGDLRDALLTHVRSMETPWSKLSERQQADKIDAINRACESLTRKAVNLVANQGFQHVGIRLGKWSVNGEVTLQVTGAGTADNIKKLADHGPGEAMLVLTEVGEYLGQRQAAKAEPDQPGLPIDGEDEGEEGGEPLAEADREFTREDAPQTTRSRRRSTIRENEPA